MVNPTTITTPFCSAIKEPGSSPFKNLSKVIVAAYRERTIRGTNPSPTVDVGLVTSRVRPHRVRPVRWQIKGLSQGLLTQGLVVK